ncbi:FAD/NAD(P)-binding protein [Mariniblastus sp.]|nr:FAD/NAD(P)-binding protein [Mariniblastus sp.]
MTSAVRSASPVERTLKNFDEYSSPLRIAIVGCGPKGFYCLESLTRRLIECRSPRLIEVNVYEDAGFPGAGRVYDPRQPKFLRMNFASKYIDAWGRAPSADSRRDSLCDFLSKARPELSDPDAFVPRAIVGEYLHECFREVMARSDDLLSVQLISQSVMRVSFENGAWAVEAGRETQAFDEVMITVGHGSWKFGEDSERSLYESVSQLFCVEMRVQPRCIPAVFPVTESLTEDALPRNSNVAIRGFALTFIDAALALTEGRGGVFETSTDGQWRYIPSGLEPAAICPFSRTGRPMFAKPTAAAVRESEELDEVWRAGLKRVYAIKSSVDSNVGGSEVRSPVDQLCSIVFAAADESLSAIQALKGRPHQLSCQCWFQKWINNRPSSDQARQVMRNSYRVAMGLDDPDEGWALAEAWRKLYPAIVEVVSHGGLAADQWDAFQNFASEMERIAFGPPAENVGRMLALIDCGILDLRLLDELTDSRALFAPMDIVIDAVIESPSSCRSDSVLGHLLQSGHLHRTYTGGIAIDESGRVQRSDGSTEAGLSVIGRATEGWVLGNDTLSRKLNSHPEKWASQMIDKYELAKVFCNE